MSADPARSSNRLPWLDGLRGLAACAVVLHHIYAISFHYYAPDSTLMTSTAVRIFLTVARWGVLGVPCFFVLSGFCVGQAWQQARSARQFALRRWWRIFPAYYASIALVLLCVLAVRLLTGVNDITKLPAPTAGNLFATLTLLTAPASATPTINWVYWTLSYEVVFYAGLTALLALPERTRPAALVVLHAAICLLGAWPGLILPPGPWFFADLWPLFGLGLALALAPRARSAAAAVGAISLLATMHLLGSERYPGMALAALVATALVAVCAAGRALPRWRLLERLGAFSYSLYLIHVPILLTLAKHLVLRPNQTPALFFASVTGAITLMVLAAYGFHRLFERPFLPSPAAVPVPVTA